MSKEQTTVNLVILEMFLDSTWPQHYFIPATKMVEAMSVAPDLAMAIALGTMVGYSECRLKTVSRVTEQKDNVANAYEAARRTIVDRYDKIAKDVTMHAAAEAFGIGENKEAS